MNWKTIYTHLQDHGFAVFQPGEHEGDCREPYLVLSLAGTQPVYGTSTDRDLYEILAYYPYHRYSGLEEYQKSIKSAMAEKRPILHIAEDFGYIYHDDDVKAYMASITYGCYKRRDLF